MRPFWKEKLYWLEEGDRTETQNPVLRVNGKHYVIEDQHYNRYFDEPRGCGGAQYFFEITIGCFAGTLLFSSNVWCQGDIPEEYRDRLYDNAVMLTPSEAFEKIKEGKKFVSFYREKGKQTEEQLRDHTAHVLGTLKRQFGFEL